VGSILTGVREGMPCSVDEALEGGSWFGGPVALERGAGVWCTAVERPAGLLRMVLCLVYSSLVVILLTGIHWGVGKFGTFGIYSSVQALP